MEIKYKYSDEEVKKGIAREFTIQEFLDALEGDNIPWYRSGWGDSKDGVVVQACALHQAAVNLGITTTDVGEVLRPFSATIAGDIMSMNDGKSVSYATIMNRAHQALDQYKDQKVRARSQLYISRLKETH